MDTKPKLNLSAMNGTSVPSRPPSPRMVPAARAPVKEHRDATRPGAQSVVATAAKRYVNAPLPASLRCAALQQSGALASDIVEESTSWNSEAAFRALIRTQQLTQAAIDDFLRDPVAWLVRVTSQLQTILLQLINSLNTAGRTATKDGSQQAAATPRATTPRASTPRCRAGVAAPSSSRGSSGRYTAPASPVAAAAAQRAGRSATSSGPSILLTAQQPPACTAQRPAVPVAALALSAAAAVAVGGCWLLRRWRAAQMAQREAQHRVAMKRDVLARQKQRFQRALVVDSVNLELPVIKDMDVKPGPVRVESILSHGKPAAQQGQVRPGAATGPKQQQRVGGGGSGQVPGLAGESLRQWQQFMSASGAEKVTNVSGSARGGRGGSQEAPSSRPFKADLDDGKLRDISERIRRANDSGSAAAAPVVTFEQLYAHSKESDEEAMARRAAERKARWQKQQPGGGSEVRRSASSTQAGPAAPAERKAPIPTATTATPPAPKTRSKPIPPDNPFTRGLFDSAPAPAGPAPSGSGRPAPSRPSGSGGSSILGNVQGRQQEPQPTLLPQKASSRADAGTSASSGGGSAGAWTVARRALPEVSSASAGSPLRRAAAAAEAGSPSNSSSLTRSPSNSSPSASSSLTRSTHGRLVSASQPCKNTLGSPGRGGNSLQAAAAASAAAASPVKPASPSKPSSPARPASPGVAAAGGGAPRSPAGGPIIALEPLSPSRPSDLRPGCEEALAARLSAREEQPQQQLVAAAAAVEHPATPGRAKRVPASGQLRTPESASASLRRLMRRPVASGAAAEAAPCSPLAEAELQQCAARE